jgi:DNA-binding transcriptional MocR family regulator
VPVGDGLIDHRRPGAVDHGEDELLLVELMGSEGMPVATDELIVTTGGQQAIDLVCKTLLDPGDVVVCEAPTYPGAVPTFCSYEADLVQIEMDSDGMVIDVLEATLDRLASDGRRPKFIYTIPTFHNPAGVTMSLPRRQRLVDLARGARAARARGQPLQHASLRGRRTADAALD